MSNYEIKTEYIPKKGRLFITSNGSKIFIGTQELDVFLKYRELPILEKVELFDINLSELEKFFDDQVKRKKKQILELLNNTWYGKETGEPVDLNVLFDYSELGLSITEIIKKCKGKSKLTITQIETILQVFLDENSDIYIK